MLLVIALVEPYGNHSNRLFQSLHYEAWCLEHGVEFLNLTFADMRPYYPACTGPRRALLGVWLKAGARTKLFKVHEFSRSEELLPYRSNPVTLVSGWNFRAPELTQKHRDYFAYRYRLDSRLVDGNPVLAQMEQWRASGNVIVGIHVRRGDYKNFANGKYYFDDSVYAAYQQRMFGLLKSQGHKAKFVVFSDEEVHLDHHDEQIVSRNPWYVDHDLMRRCDYLLGPPSTFTHWASYVGQVKCFHIQGSDESLALTDFAVAEG